MNFEEQLLTELENMAKRQMKLSALQNNTQKLLVEILAELQKPAPPSELLTEIASLLRELVSRLDRLPKSD